MIDPSADRPRSKVVIVGFIVFLALTSVGMLHVLLSPDPQPVTKPGTLITGPPKRPFEGSHATIGGHPACMTREQLGRIIQFLAQKDSVAFDKMIANGSCVVLKPQVWVFIMEGTPTSEIVKIRPQGQTDGMWTVRQAID